MMTGGWTRSMFNLDMLGCLRRPSGIATAHLFRHAPDCANALVSGHPCPGHK